MKALVLLALAGCASKYAYTFHVTDPGVHAAAKAGDPDTVEDDEVKADVLVDPAAEAIVLTLTNKTDQILAVEWNEIRLTRTDVKTNAITTLRPDADLGWIQPGANLAARLLPLALPRKGSDAAAYEGRRFDLKVPMIVRREAKVYHYAIVAHVKEL
jgi:hypothetical protein